MAYDIAYGFAQGSTFHEFDKRQQRLTTNGSTRQLALMPGCTLWLSSGVRTGGRVHPGSAGSDYLNNAPSSSRACPGGFAIAGAFAMTNLVSGSELEGTSSALRSIACLIACPPCPCSVFSALPSHSGSLRGSTGPVACSSACLLPSAVLFPAP